MYQLDYAKKMTICKGPKDCSSTILKGELRFGTKIQIKDHDTFVYRHFGCITPTVAKNMKENLFEFEDIDGLDSVKKEDKEKLRFAWDNGHIRDEDVTPSLIKEVVNEIESASEDEYKLSSSKKLTKSNLKKLTSTSTNSKASSSKVLKKKRSNVNHFDDSDDEEFQVSKSKNSKKSKSKRTTKIQNDDSEEEKPKIKSKKKSKKT